MRALWVLAAGFALLACAAYVGHLADVRIMDGARRRVIGNESLPPEQLLVRITDFAHREIPNPKISELPPGVRLYYMLNPTHPGAADVVRWGSDYRGGCGSHTNVAVAMLEASGVQARPLFLLGKHGERMHTVVQARIDGRWVVSDPLFGIVFRTRDGRLATAEDLAADTTTFRAQTAHARWYDRRYDYDCVSIMNWGKVPVVLPAVKTILARIVGPARVNDIARPDIWMWPRALAAVLCALLAAGFALAAMLTARARRHRMAPRVRFETHPIHEAAAPAAFASLSERPSPEGPRRASRPQRVRIPSRSSPEPTRQEVRR